MRLIASIVVSLLLASVPALGVVHESTLPLHDGKLSIGTLTQKLADELGLPDLTIDSKASVDLSGLKGSLWIKAIDASLGKACQLKATPDALKLSIDLQKLPRSLRSVKQAIRLFTATAAPQATAEQQRNWGLILPPHLSADQPLVILIHGLDCDGTDWASMADLLRQSHYQVALFQYPDDQPISQSAAFFARKMQSLQRLHPRMSFDLITHSMGALVARDYVEGPLYEGHVRRLIMIAPPNHGSSWAILQPLLELHQQYESWRHDPDWHWTWFITDGLGEAGVDLEPDSHFLKQLNDHPRRSGVQYTIIAGDHTPWQKWEAAGLAAVAGYVPPSLSRLPGISFCRARLRGWADHIEHRQGRSDGVVSLKSASLAGVSDLVILPDDHDDLYRGVGDQPPAAWPAICQRLAR